MQIASGIRASSFFVLCWRSAAGIKSCSGSGHRFSSGCCVGSGLPLDEIDQNKAAEPNSEIL